MWLCCLRFLSTKNRAGLAVLGVMAAVFAIQGCFNPNLDGAVRCDQSMSCPDGLLCDTDGVCRSVAIDAGQVALLTQLTVFPADASVLGFKPTTFNYSFSTSLLTQSVVVTAVADSGTTLMLNGESLVSGKPSLVPIDRGGQTLTITASAPSALDSTYQVIISRAATPRGSAFAKASNTDLNDQFGNAIAVSGDTLVVGAESEDSDGDSTTNSLDSSGAVYVYRKTPQGWMFEAMLKAPIPAFADRFGAAVAVDGDTLAVGVPLEDSDAIGVGGAMDNDNRLNSGAVMIFTRSGQSWQFDTFIKASNPGANDQFGVAVDLDNGVLVVGAYRESSSARGVNGLDNDDANSAGAAYIFRKTLNGWAQEAYLKASNSEASDFFGYKVAVSGDTVAVSAHGEDSNSDAVGGAQFDNSASAAGAVYVFRYVLQQGDGMWSQEAYVKATNSEASDLFGTSLDLSGDRLVVGAYNEDSSGRGVGAAQDTNDAAASGAVYLYGRAGTTWFVDEFIKASNSEAGDDFGYAVAVEGNLVFVSAIGEDSAAPGLDMGQQDNGAQFSGAGYLFERQMSGWVQVHYIKSPDPDSSDVFGRSAALSPSGLFVGVSGEDSGSVGLGGDPANNDSANSGAVFVFE